MLDYGELLEFCETERQKEIINKLIEVKRPTEAAKSLSVSRITINQAVRRVRGYAGDKIRDCSLSSEVRFEKMCSKCKKTKNVNEFSSNNTGKYGKYSACKTCRAEHSRSELEQDRARKYYSANKKTMDENSRKWTANNKDRIAVTGRKWRYKNHEKIKTIYKNAAFKRRTILKKGISTHRLLEWEQQQQKICYWCSLRCDKEYHIDHYFPISKGGKHEMDNLVISCPTCNLTKSAKDPYLYANEKGRLL